jgi:hypothetical protein
MDQTNNDMFSIFFCFFIFKIVQIKLIEPKIDEIPAKCKLKIVQSTADDL